MIKKAIKLSLLGLVLSAGVHAQSVQDGIKALYSGKYFEAAKILQTQSGTPEGAYWLAQTYLEHDDVPEANNVITKALAAKPTDPLLLVAKGQLLLKENKVAEAKQNFETAINSAGKGGKATILNAVGKAVTRVYNNITKVGDINYAVQKLQEALATEKGEKEKNQNKWLLADIYTNLGDALRKAKPGDGSAPFENYQNALQADPSFAQAEYRKALIFKSQRNYDLFLENLNKAITANPGFLPAYYEQYYYKLGTGDNAGAQQIADKIKQNSPGDPNNEYFTASTYYINKQYDQAIASAKNVIATAKDLANPSAYKVIAYSLIDKKDTAAAIPYVEEYFKKQHAEEFMPKDYTLKAMAYSTTPGKESVVYQTYLDGLKADTVLENRIEMLDYGAKFLTGKGQFDLAGDLYSKLIEIKPADRVTINDYFNAGYYGYYRAKDYEKSWKIFDQVRTKFPKQNYGYLWTFRNSSVFDSTNAKNTMVPDAEKLIEFSKSDTARDAKPNILSSSFFLANYYNEVVKDKTKAIEYLIIARDAGTDDPAVKQQIQQNIDMLQKAANARPAAGGSNGTKPKTTK